MGDTWRVVLRLLEDGTLVVTVTGTFGGVKKAVSDPLAAGFTPAGAVAFIEAKINGLIGA